MQETKKAVIIEDNADVDFIKSGNIVEIRYLEYRNTENHVKRIDKEHMLNDITGEVKDIQHHEKRIDDLTSVRRSMANLRRIINANCTEPKKCKWVTLTYKENMQDTKRLYLDFQHYVQEIRRQYGSCEYIAVAEPQARGAWHLHVILIYENEAPYIANKEMAEIWGKGFTKTTALEECDNVGAYLTAYLADIPAEEIKEETAAEIKKVNVSGKEKKFVKGARLSLYPAGFRFARWSRGIKRPEKETIPYIVAKRKVSAATLTYASTKHIQTEKVDMLAKYEQYNATDVSIAPTKEIITRICDEVNREKQGLVRRKADQQERSEETYRKMTASMKEDIEKIIEEAKEEAYKTENGRKNIENRVEEYTKEMEEVEMLPW